MYVVYYNNRRLLLTDLAKKVNEKLAKIWTKKLNEFRKCARLSPDNIFAEKFAFERPLERFQELTDISSRTFAGLHRIQ